MGFPPYREPGTRCTPRVDDVGIAARLGTNPLQQVQDQGFDGIRHNFLLVSGNIGALPPGASGTTDPSLRVTHCCVLRPLPDCAVGWRSVCKCWSEGLLRLGIVPSL